MTTCLGKSCSFALSNCVCPSFSGIEGGMWDVIVSIPDHCHSIYFDSIFIRLCLNLLSL